MANYFEAPGIYDNYNVDNSGASFSPYRPNPYNPYNPYPIVPSGSPRSAQQGRQNSNIPWIPVPNVEGAKSVMIGPNQIVYMMSQNSNEFYVKSTDAMGVATLHCYEFQEFDPAAKSMQASVAQSQNFISRDEFNNFVANVSTQFAALQQTQIQSPILTQNNTQQAQQSVDLSTPQVPASSKNTNGKKSKEE